MFIFKMFFYFQDASEVNGIQVPFTIRIQIVTYIHAMLQFGHNKAIFMDVTFGSNDVKYHLFILMACLISITQGCPSLRSSQVDKYVKIWWNGWVPYKQSSSHICHIGNHHVSLWMPHRNSEHWGRLYVFKNFVTLFYVCVLCLTWGLRNVFIVHDKHIDVRCTMQDYVESRSCPSFPLCMACVESMVFMLHRNNQGCKSKMCNIQSPSYNDVHVHQPK